MEYISMGNIGSVSDIAELLYISLNTNNKKDIQFFK